MNDESKNPDMIPWSVNSWKTFKISQQPIYKDTDLLNNIKNKISSLPPIVNYKEIIVLKEKLKLCHNDECFIIQVGDCAERFIDTNEELIKRQIIFFNVLSHALSYHLKKETLIIGRIAGQYAKPRSSPHEITQSGGKLILIVEKIQAFRGEIINEFPPIEEKRIPNPERMLQAYFNSITTINEINNWNSHGDKSIDVFKSVLSENKLEIKSDSFLKNMTEYYENFPSDIIDLEKNNIFTSHEGLLLNYEECFLRKINDDYYDLSGHFLWIGERTGNSDEAHIEFFRGINNPIGIKVSSRLNLDELMETIKILNPKNERGKIVLITRFGYENAESSIENLCKKLSHYSINVVIICDPNHGNTKIHEISKKKVRYFDEIKNEIIITNKVLQNHGFFLSGIHLEATSFDITECIGGLDFQVTDIVDDLYTTFCDPRLNLTQTMELCDYIGKIISSEK